MPAQEDKGLGRGISDSGIGRSSPNEKPVLIGPLKHPRLKGLDLLEDIVSNEKLGSAGGLKWRKLN